MNKIKVLQVNKLYSPHTGGIEKVVQDIAEGLNDRVDMKVLVCQTKGKTCVEKLNDVEITRAGSFGVFFSMPLSFSFFYHLRKLSKDRDIVHFHMPFPLGDAAFFLSGYKGKVILWWHSDIVRQKALIRVYRPILKKFLDRADCIIVATEGHINGSKYLQSYRHKCVVIPFGINVQSLLSSTDQDNFQKTLNIDKLKKVLFIGRLIYYKGVDVLLNAFSHINGARLYIVGDGPLRMQLEKQAIELNIDKNVEFMGHLDDIQIKILLNECDMLVLPSVANSEAFGIVQIEAMAFSKPVINTSLPTGVPYVSIHEQTGLTVPPGDVKALSLAIQRLIDNDDERIQMGINAQKRAIKHFELNNMLNKVFTLYQNILK